MTLLIPRLAAPGIGGAQQLTVIIGRSYQVHDVTHISLLFLITDCTKQIA